MARRIPWLMRLVAFAATLALHSMLLMVSTWGDGQVSKPRIPDAYGAAANMGSASGTSEERMMIILLPAEPSQDPPPIVEPELAAPHAEAAILQIAGPDALPVKPWNAQAEGEDNPNSEADMIARMKLVGVYEGQIRARIERAWLRPKEPITDAEFRCRVKIRQSRTGVVEEVEFEQCNGNPRWQGSLANAVFAASPLPAPPHDDIWVAAFSLSFNSLAYSAHSDAQGFEAQPAVVAFTTAAQDLAGR
jgi:hypothetical protein